MITTSSVAILRRFQRTLTPEDALAELGVDVPADVTAARAVVDALAAAEQIAADGAADLAEAVAAGAVKPGDVAKRVTAAATIRAAAQHRTAVVNAAAPAAEARVAELLAAHADAITVQVRPRFDAAAEKIARAVELGIEPATSPADALQAGSDVAEAYVQLSRVAGQIEDALLAVHIARGSSGLPVGMVLDADAMPEPRDGRDPLDDAKLLWQAPTAVPGERPSTIRDTEDGYEPGGPALSRGWPDPAAPGARWLALVKHGFALRLNLPGECPAPTLEDVVLGALVRDPVEVDDARAALATRKAARVS